MQFQYRRRYREGYNDDRSSGSEVRSRVSIPKTVSGGLQQGSICMYKKVVMKFQYRRRYREGYNFDDASVMRIMAFVSIPKTVSGGLQLLNHTAGMIIISSFNTEDGIGRATT